GTALKFVKASWNGGELIQNENIYNASGHIQTRISYKDYAAGIVSSQTDYAYKNEKLVQKEEKLDISSSTLATQYLYSRTVFEYNNNRIIQQYHYLKENDQYKLGSFTVFSYNNVGLPIKQSRYSPDGVLFGYISYTYENGNVVLSEEYKVGASNVLTAKHNYKYDNMKNPYRDMYQTLENIPFSLNNNNIVEATATNYNINPFPAMPTLTASYTNYEYNNKGFPSTMNENGHTFILVYE
ncbi:MAG TPA: hypothetical protein VFV68_08120, partial [Agriterribacter sp.]|nr:hypothetical protein [Agriterribacter sp.]